MNILEEFWCGNIELAEYDTSSGKEYKELLQLISRNEDKLLATMTEEQEGTVYQVCRLCQGISGYGRVPAVPE